MRRGRISRPAAMLPAIGSGIVRSTTALLGPIGFIGTVVHGAGGNAENAPQDIAGHSMIPGSRLATHHEQFGPDAGPGQHPCRLPRSTRRRTGTVSPSGYSRATIRLSMSRASATTPALAFSGMACTISRPAWRRRACATARRSVASEPGEPSMPATTRRGAPLLRPVPASRGP